MSEENLSSSIWSVAGLLRGDYKQSEYGKVILLFTVLRRLDCALEATKVAVIAEILEAFKTYHTTAALASTTDPNIVLDLLQKLDVSSH